MSIFSAVGDFFRSPFEDDQEKKRRKEREQREAQQRAAQQKAQAPKTLQKPTANDMGFKPIKNPTVQTVVPSLNAQRSLPKKEDKPKAPQQSLFYRLIGDKLDANTEADKFTREQAGKPRDYREAQRDAGEKDISNPFAKVAFEFAKPIAQGANTLTSAGVGIYRETDKLGDLLKLKGQYEAGKLSKADYNRLSKEIGDRGTEARFGGNRGLLGVGGFYNDTAELEDKKKLAGAILQTGGNLSQVLPLGKATSLGVKGVNTVRNEVIQNVVGGVASEGGRQVSEGKFDPKSLLIGGAIDSLTPLALNKFGGVLGSLKRSGASDDVIEAAAKKVRDASSPREAEKIIDDLDNMKPAEKPKVDTPEVKLKEELPVKNLPEPMEKVAVKVTDDINRATREELEKIRNSLLTPDQKSIRTEQVMARYRQAMDEVETNTKKSAQAVKQSTDKQAAEVADIQKTNAEALKTEEVDVPAGQNPVGDTEVDFNRAYFRDIKNEVGRMEEQLKIGQEKKLADNAFGDSPTFDERSRSVFQTLSPDRAIRENITEPLRDKIDEVIFKAQTSKNPIARLLGRATQGVSREAGVSQDLLAAKRRQRGGIETGKIYRDKIFELGEGISDDSKRRIWASLDPEQAGKIGQATDLSLFSPEELAERARLANIAEVTSDRLYQVGLLDEAQWQNKEYFKRAYNVFEQDVETVKAYNDSRDGLLKQFKERADVDMDLLRDAVTDPYYLAAKKTAEAESAISMVNYGKYLDDNGLTSTTPRPGYEQLPDSRLHGPAAGKWVPRAIVEDFTGFKYTAGMLNSFNDFVSAYDNLAIRKGKKALLTVGNPAVRVGNQFSNRVIFSNFNGINPLQFNATMQEVKGMIKEGHQLYREAVAQGLTGTDITAAEFAQKIAGYTDPNVAKKALDYIKNSYSAADDQAKLAAYVVHRRRGYSPEEAAKLTQRGFQDYNSVGFFYDLAAKTPLIGNAFVRFAADAMRIAKNAALDHPLRSAGTIWLWAEMVDKMSQLSGESAEDKKTRENRFGAPKIPFTDISLAVQTPWGEVNVARFIPFYELNDIGNPATRLMPFGQNPFKPQGWQDPLLGQALQVATDQDFRGKSIQDPENVKFADGTSKFEEDPLSGEEKRNNLLRFLFTNNAPMGREIDAVKSSVQGEEDVYGKKRSLTQSLLRAGGVKVEQYGEEQAADTRGTEAYFDRKEQVDKEVEGMTPAAQAAYRRLTGQYKLRDEEPNPFSPGETINTKAPIYDFSEQKWGEYMQNPELFGVMEQRAQRESQANGSPLRPEFDPRLPKNFRLQLIQQKSIAPGDDIELQERMYTDPLWDTYLDIKDEYKAKAATYYPESNDDFTDDMVKHKDADFPKKPPEWKAYTDAKARGEEPEWNDRLAAIREQYELQKLNWTNIERGARGLPPIPAEQWFNKSFGYTPEKKGSGWGFGGGGGGNNDWGILGDISNTNLMRRLEATQVAETPNLKALFKKLQAKGGGRAKPKLGASSRGQA